MVKIYRLPMPRSGKVTAPYFGRKEFSPIKPKKSSPIYFH